MSIFGRFKDIMSANVNALFDSWEDPGKMVDQHLRNMARDVAAVKQATAEVMGVAKAARRRVDEQQREVDKFQGLALKAAQADKRDDARVFLAKKNELEGDLVEMQEQLAAADKNAAEVRRVYDKLVSDMQTLQKRKASIKANIAISKAQETAAGAVNGRLKRGESAAAAFERMENKVKARRDSAAALIELDSVPECDATALMNQYKGGGGFAVESELEALMASVGKPISKEESVDCEIQALIEAAEAGNMDEPPEEI